MELRYVPCSGCVNVCMKREGLCTYGFIPQRPAANYFLLDVTRDIEELKQSCSGMLCEKGCEPRRRGNGFGNSLTLILNGSQPTTYSKEVEKPTTHGLQYVFFIGCPKKVWARSQPACAMRLVCWITGGDDWHERVRENPFCANESRFGSL